ncbi:MAG: TRAP transporter small permease [Gammaproteobacteria bacterium]|nr:TRAP transporter small permease [Gammaproteobacteria bacterium]
MRSSPASRRFALTFSGLGGLGRAIERWLQIVETTLLVALLAAMIGFAAYQIIARNAFGAGLGWADGLVQVALLWVTMVGASAAAGADRHIKIDIVPRFAGPRTRTLAARFTALATAILCAALGWTSIEFIRWDFTDGTVGFGAVPAWVCESIIPLAAGVMAARYLARALWPGGEREGSAPP